MKTLVQKRVDESENKEDDHVDQEKDVKDEGKNYLTYARSEENFQYGKKRDLDNENADKDKLKKKERKKKLKLKRQERNRVEETKKEEEIQKSRGRVRSLLSVMQKVVIVVGLMTLGAIMYGNC